MVINQVYMSFYPPTFLIFSGVVEREQWPEKN